MMVGRDQDLGLSLGLNSSQHHDYRFPLQLNLMPSSSSSPFIHHNSSQWNNLLALSSGERRLREIDVNRTPTAERESEEEAGESSPNSTMSSVSGKRGMGEREVFQNGDEHNDVERDCSREVNSDEEYGEGSRKKLRLSKDQSAILEESFKEHHTLNPKQKHTLAKQLNLRPRQVEVWFQNRRARTKLKQTEVDCEFLKRCCENLTEENRRLHKEVQELRALKLSPQFYMHTTPPTTLTMCPSCERMSSSAATMTANQGRPVATVPGPWPPISLRGSFLDAATAQR